MPIRLSEAFKARAEVFAASYRSGLTLEQIGQAHGLTRERVRQVLAKVGITRWSGGVSLNASKKRSMAIEGYAQGLRTKDAAQRAGLAKPLHFRAIASEQQLAARRSIVRELREAMFWDRIDRTGGPDACWPWTGVINPNGYGYVSLRHLARNNLATHKAAYFFAHGELPRGFKIFIMHTCDERYPRDSIEYRKCCNPKHLKQGTPKENTQHAMKIGRRPMAKWAGWKERYAGDPIFREKQKAVMRARYARKAKDPEFRAKERARYHARKAKLAQEPKP